jgi:selT/selW/selH-like putative selenoprotein
VKSGGGVFEITIDGKLGFSKKAAGRFPEENEIKALVG